MCVDWIDWFAVYVLNGGFSSDDTRNLPINLISRDEWKNHLKLPVERIILAHTADDPYSCSNVDECKFRVRNIQRNHSQLMDIPYNFLIDGSGSIFEDRGFYDKGEHTANSEGSSYNSIGIGYAFIGTFESDPTSNKQIGIFKNFLDYFTKE